jgi:hypothetical protein
LETLEEAFASQDESLRLRKRKAWRWIQVEAPQLAGTILEIGQVFGVKPKLNTLHDAQGRLIFEDRL